MAYTTKTASNTTGNQNTTITYSCKTLGIGYSLITENINEAFNFLIKDIPQNLEEAMKSLESTKNKSAFSFCRGDSSSGDYEDLTLVCNEIERDINNLKSELSSLYKTLLEDINNINKELEYNFGWAVAGQYKKESIQNENIEY